MANTIVIPSIEELVGKQKQPDGFTIRELHEKTGRSLIELREIIRKAITDGKCKCIGKKVGTNIAGRPLSVPAYQLVKGKKA